MIKVSAIIPPKLVCYIQSRSQENLCSNSVTIRQLVDKTRKLIKEDETAQSLFADVQSFCYLRSPTERKKKRVSFSLDQENGEWLKSHDNINLALNQVIIFDYLYSNYLGG